MTPSPGSHHAPLWALAPCGVAATASCAVKKAGPNAAFALRPLLDRPASIRRRPLLVAPHERVPRAGATGCPTGSTAQGRQSQHLSITSPLMRSGVFQPVPQVLAWPPLEGRSPQKGTQAFNLLQDFGPAGRLLRPARLLPRCPSAVSTRPRRLRPLLQLTVQACAPNLRLYLWEQFRPRRVPRGTAAAAVFARLTNGEVAALFEQPRRTRASSLTRALLFQLARRYLLTLREFKIGVRLVGVLGQFSSSWLQLASPLNETYAHPLTTEWVPDLRLPWARRLSAPELAAAVTELVAKGTLGSEEGRQPPVTAILPALIAFFARQGRDRRPGVRQSLWRYSLR